jgi:hypothetical protein
MVLYYYFVGHLVNEYKGFSSTLVLFVSAYVSSCFQVAFGPTLEPSLHEILLQMIRNFVQFLCEPIAEVFREEGLVSLKQERVFGNKVSSLYPGPLTFLLRLLFAHVLTPQANIWVINGLKPFDFSVMHVKTKQVLLIVLGEGNAELLHFLVSDGLTNFFSQLEAGLLSLGVHLEHLLACFLGFIDLLLHWLLELPL